MSDAGTSIAETVAALDAPPPKEEKPAAQAPAKELTGKTPPATEPAPDAETETDTDTEIEGEPTPEDADAPETASEGEEGDEQEEAEKPELPAIEPPKFWDADDKKAFSALSREDQERVLKYETQRTTATSKAIQETAERRKIADAEASKLSSYVTNLDKLIPQAEQTFKGRWDNVDWTKAVEELGAEETLKLRYQFEQEQSQLQQLQSAKAEVERVQFGKFVEAESAKLPELCPDLVDPKEGPKRRAALTEYLVKGGIPQDRLPYVTAQESSIAYKAMLWDQSQAKAAEALAKPRPKPPVPPSRTPVRPTAQPVRGSQQSATIKSLQGRFDADPSVKNLEALLNAQG